MPARVSVSADRGLAYCPANRPTRMIGFFKPCSSTRLICNRIFRRLAMLSDSQSAKLSAQSPPWSRNSSPRCARASRARKASTSQETTSGGRRLNAATARSSAAGSAYFGCWVAGRPCQLAGCQLVNWGDLDMAPMLHSARAARKNSPGLALRARARQNAAPQTSTESLMSKAHETLQALGLDELNAGSWSGSHGWSSLDSAR